MDNKKIIESVNNAITKHQKEIIKESLKSLHTNKPRKVIPTNECKTSLQWFRKSNELSQSQLAEKSGVNLRMIQNYEQGFKDINKAQAITLYKLAQALDCTIEDLLELEGLHE